MKKATELINQAKYDVEQKIKEELKYADAPKLIIIREDNDDKATESYVTNKLKLCSSFGIKSEVITISEKPDDLARIIFRTAQCDTYSLGIIVQMPFFGFTQQEIETALKRARDWGAKFVDADGFVDKYELSRDVRDLPATSRAVYEMITLGKRYIFNGKQRLTIAVVGQSELVTKPLAFALINDRHTVLSMNSLSDKDFLRYADIVVLATGQLQSFKGYDLGRKTFVIDVGIGRLDGKLCGDFKPDDYDFNDGIHYTPVPNGIGQLTTRFLLLKLLEGVNA